MDHYDDILKGLSGKRSRYSDDEIEQALRKSRKNGGNFLDTLKDSKGQDRQKKDTAPSMNADSLMKELENLDRELKQDFGDDIGSVAAEASSASMAASEPVKEVTADSFKGLAEDLEKNVYGQTEFLKKLSIAFKRPFVMPEEAGFAKNAIYVYGPKDTGKHLALETMAQVLSERKVFAHSGIKGMDLSIYSMAGKDNVFLQDLYSALKSSESIIVFENIADCHISYLNYISDLVIKGKCQLQDRYIMQKGQLVNVNNSFAESAISAFTAEGKYLVFLGEKGVNSLADTMGAPFINALGDVCTTISLEEESYKKIAADRLAFVTEKAKKQLGFIISTEGDGLIMAAVAATGRNAGTAGLLEFFNQLLKSLATLKLEGDYDLDTEVKLTVEEGTLYAVIGEEKKDLIASLPSSYTGAVDAVKEELNQIVGLTKVKEYILSLEEYYSTQKRRKEAGLKASEVSKHMIFTGNPGTGKTTIARIVSRYLKAIGVLTGGQLVEVSRADLVGRYVGHTAPLVNNVIKSAIGGVLFIDEAYSLYHGKDDSFGLEAIDTLVKGIEDNRDNLIVILAGYSKEMEEFLEANSGLKSRFPNYIDFPDYTGEELLSIAEITIKSKGYVLDETAKEDLLKYFCERQMLDAATAGNGRLVRNKVEEAILNQSRRLVAEPDADLSLLKKEDFVLTIE